VYPSQPEATKEGRWNLTGNGGTWDVERDQFEESDRISFMKVEE
jgi:hypothetical protein